MRTCNIVVVVLFLCYLNLLCCLKRDTLVISKLVCNLSHSNQPTIKEKITVKTPANHSESFQNNK